MTFTVGGVAYRYCLYSPDDPTFTYTGTSYTLLKGAGSLACGTGVSLASGIAPSVFTLNGPIKAVLRHYSKYILLKFYVII